MSQQPQAGPAGRLAPGPTDVPSHTHEGFGPWWRQVTIAVGLAVLAMAMRLALDPLLHDRQPFTPAYAAVALAGWLVGWRAGLLTAVLCHLAGNYFFIAPRGAFTISSTELVGAGTYYLIAGVILYLGHRAVTANRALRRALTELGQVNDRKSKFLAVLAHELRNPLAALGAGSDALSTDRLDAARRAEIHAVMQRQVQQMKRVVDDLLDVGRIDQGRIVLRQAPLQVAQLVRETAAMARAFTDPMAQTLSVSLPAPDCSVNGDADRLMQVLSNLLHNASKFSPRGATIELAVRADPVWVHIDVRDPGLGLPADRLEHIFGAFVQLAPRGEHGDGIGLGLSLVRHLVSLHGGTVQATSAGPGKGACFTVSLPRTAESAATAPRPVAAAAAEPVAAPRTAPVAPPPVATAAPERAAAALALPVLVVDDNLDAAASLALVLELHGHAVRVAHDGAQALASVAEVWPAIAFVDIGLPDMDGFELAQRLREQAGGRALRLVALTGWGSEDDLRRAHEAGFDSHHTKPINLEALAAHLQRLAPALGQPGPAAGDQAARGAPASPPG